MKKHNQTHTAADGDRSIGVTPTMRHRQSGAALLYYILCILALGILTAPMVSMFNVATDVASTEVNYKRAYYMAESGLRYAYSELDKAQNSTHLDSIITTLNNTDFGVNSDANEWFDIEAFSLSSFISRTAGSPIPSNNDIIMELPNGGVNSAFLTDLNWAINYSTSTPHGLYGINADKDGVNFTQGQNLVLLNAAVQGNSTAYIVFKSLSAVTADNGDEFYLGADIDGNPAAIDSSTGGTINIGSGGRVFPDRQGAVYLKGQEFFYDKKVYNGDGTYTLYFPGQGKTVDMGPSEFVILNSTTHQNYYLSVTGYAGVSSRAKSFDLVGSVAVAAASDDDEDETPPITQMEETFENLDNWETSSGDVIIATGISALNVHDYYGVENGKLDEIKFYSDDATNVVKGAWMLLDYNGTAGADDKNDMEVAWKYKNRYVLHYDIQVKQGWIYRIRYGFQGIFFRHHPSGYYDHLEAFNTYGLGFMIYTDGAHKVDWDTNDYNDGIPSTVKPYASTPGDLANKLLLVLWKQTQDTGTGAIHRTWIAYKDISDLRNVAGDHHQQWRFDGAGITDNASLLVRVRERKNCYDTNKKCNDIQVFLGDSSIQHSELDGQVPSYENQWSWNYYVTLNSMINLPPRSEMINGPHYRTPDGKSYTYGDDRQVYYPKYGYTDPSADPYDRIPDSFQPFPAWPPAYNGTGTWVEYGWDHQDAYEGTDPNDWNATANDFWTMIVDEPASGDRSVVIHSNTSYYDPATEGSPTGLQSETYSMASLTWDGYNSAVFSSSQTAASFDGTKAIVLTDGGTIRDASFVTPYDETEAFDIYTGDTDHKRREVGLYAFSASTYEFYNDDFAIVLRGWNTDSDPNYND